MGVYLQLCRYIYILFFTGNILWSYNVSIIHLNHSCEKHALGALKAQAPALPLIVPRLRKAQGLHKPSLQVRF